MYTPINIDPNTSLRRIYEDRLSYHLSLCLGRRDTVRAWKILQALFSFQRTRFEILWKGGVTVLQTHPNHQVELTRFFQLLFTRHSEHREELLLEMTYHQIQLGNIQDAYGTMMGYIYHSPFSENPLIHGYAGMLSAHIAEKENANLRRSQSSAPSSQGMDLYGSMDPDEDSNDKQVPAQRNVLEAIKHFEKACALDEANDMFTRCLVELLFKSGQHKEAITVMEDFCRRNPKNPAIQHMLFTTLYTDSPDNPEVWLEHAKLCVKLDPACSVESVIRPMIQYYEEMINTEKGKEKNVSLRLEILQLLATRIDYGNNEIWVWEKTVETLMRLKKKSPEADTEIWKDRLSWWSSFLFLHLPVPSTELHPDSEQDRLLGK
ncbi:TATA box-binding protein-associated factor RNA polymerase I subunit A, variant 2 [Basidiobolus ranarum]|uniref:TATA box-binding protein-associated factor RNA polymerase I subunit A, variant 2 n=1 Tax=Basidiobolus ranarum TaxID=34480 RepID=A0ABR2X3K4_9FUNG